MKNLPLSMQIWLVFAAIMLSISILLSILFPWTLRDFFTREIYATIESAQSLTLNRFNNEFSRETWKTGILPDRKQQIQDIRTVNHFILIEDSQEVIASRLPVEFLYTVRDHIKDQTSDVQRYSGQIGDQKIFYVVAKEKVLDQNIFLVSYMWDSYREDLVQTLLRRLVFIMSLVFILSWLPSLGLAKYLSKPLVTLEMRVKKLANRDWQEPIQLQREDEIGRLGQSMEQLRNQLIKQDEAQQSFLQHTSHELKTPVMVIRSYTQAIQDGIYPKGNLTTSVRTIEEEAMRLEKSINNLLYLTKLDYLATHNPSNEQVAMDQLIKDVVERFRWRRSELNWTLKLSPTFVKGNIDQWRVVLENLLDNQTRYAQSKILISLANSEYPNEKLAYLRIWNDGPSISAENIDDIFGKFQKGPQGEVGLGLAIVHRVISLVNGNIRVKNEVEGVSFYLEIPSS
ncbi:HAMP domain-containing histidine kinase [Alkaliphilus sp. MSJ-5]|uniref:histidine kinase n=1 Tax=Alkaliphilus flagellatus TaxID=2841507 RepID=A0ABS6G0U2_9FIRM|nr:HAMP domain-containing sensor histidine kinase [Alkaliphilus flagellatus]MBU5676118.1 HAMP domain-containing histidine kinase [Alkaliphilus flagellatus]